MLKFWIISLCIYMGCAAKRTNPGQVVGLRANDNLEMRGVDAGLVDQQVVLAMHVCKNRLRLYKLCTTILYQNSCYD